MSIQELQTSRLDINNNYEIDITLKQLDDIILKIIVYDKSLPADLSNYTARLKAFKSDQVPLIQNTQIYINNNEVTIKGDPQLGTTSGIVKAELQFINKTTFEKKSTFYININVVASVLETDRGISVATCTLLKEIENALDKLENIGDILVEATEVNTELKDTTIPAANVAKINLESSIDDANESKLALEQSKTNADTSKSALDESIEEANNSKSAIDLSKTNADNSKAALDESIEEANNFVNNHGDIINLDNRVTELAAQTSEITNQNPSKRDGSYKKKLVIFGSSVASGSVSPTYGGWSNLLTQNLGSKGWTVINKSIGGNTTTNLIDRFYTDVVPEYPDIVIVALSLNNEGIFGSEPEAIYNQFKANIIKLCRMIRQQGIIPIVSGTYPNNLYTSEHYRYIKQFNRELETLGVVSFDFLGAVDDLTGHWLTNSFYNEGHPNDAGHMEMFGAIPPSIFDTLLNWNDTSKQSYNGYLEMGTDTTTIAPISYTPQDAFRSWSISFWLKNNTGVNGKSFLAISDSTARLRNPNGVLQWTGNGVEIVSNVDIVASTSIWRHVVLTHNEIEQVTRLYIDGTLAGSTTESILLTKASFMGRIDSAANASGYQMRDIAIYRTRLNAEQVLSLYNGIILKSSLELFSPLSDIDTSVNTHLINLAPTNSYLKINSGAFIHKSVPKY